MGTKKRFSMHLDAGGTEADVLHRDLTDSRITSLTRMATLPGTAGCKISTSFCVFSWRNSAWIPSNADMWHKRSWYTLKLSGIEGEDKPFSMALSSNKASGEPKLAFTPGKMYPGESRLLMLGLAVDLTPPTTMQVTLTSNVMKSGISASKEHSTESKATVTDRALVASRAQARDLFLSHGAHANLRSHTVPLAAPEVHRVGYDDSDSE